MMDALKVIFFFSVKKEPVNFRWCILQIPHFGLTLNILCLMQSCIVRPYFSCPSQLFPVCHNNKSQRPLPGTWTYQRDILGDPQTLLCHSQACTMRCAFSPAAWRPSIMSFMVFKLVAGPNRQFTPMIEAPTQRNKELLHFIFHVFILFFLIVGRCLRE